MVQEAMIIDMDRCVGCGACVLACQEEWELPGDISRNWVRPIPPKGSTPNLINTHYVGMCNHCSRPTCLDVCPSGATYRDEHKRVVVDKDLCIGCGYCIETCPYGARVYNDETKSIEKCDFCARRVDAGLLPACVATCPAGARIFGDLNDPNSAVSKYFANHRIARLTSAKVQTEPQVYYAGKREVIDLIASENPPDARKIYPPVEGRILEQVVRPGLLGLLGLVFTGQTIAFFRQLIVGEKDDVSEWENKPGDTSEEPMLHRHDRAAIALHWFNALVWIFQLTTGLALLGGSRYAITPSLFNDFVISLFGSRKLLMQLHITTGEIWLAVLLIYGVFGFKRYLLPLLMNLKLNRRDLSWLGLKLKKMLKGSSGIDLPAQGKYNAGQKLCGIVVSAGTVIVAASGLILINAPGTGELIRWAVTVHLTASAVVLVVLLLHLFMTVLSHLRG